MGTYNLVPIAISSQFDDSGVERIHAATRRIVTRTPLVPVAGEPHFAYFIGEINNHVSRVGYAKVSPVTGQVTVLASIDHPEYLGLHEGGLAASTDTIFVGGFDAIDRLLALRPVGSNLTEVASWARAKGNPSDNSRIISIGASGSTVFVLNEYYDWDTGLEQGALHVLEFDGDSFTEITSFPFNQARFGGQLLVVGDYVVVSPGNIDMVTLLNYDGTSLSQTDTLSFTEVGSPEFPFISTDGTTVFFTPSSSGTGDGVSGYTIDSAGLFVNINIPTTDLDNFTYDGNRAGEDKIVVRVSNSEGAFDGVPPRAWHHLLSVHNRAGNVLNQDSEFHTRHFSWQPWGYDKEHQILYAPTGLEAYASALDNELFIDNTGYYDPLDSSGIFDLSKSMDFVVWGSTSVPTNIPDNTGPGSYVSSSITISGVSGETCRAAVDVSSILHAYTGDLAMELVSPNGQVAHILMGHPDNYTLPLLHATYPNPSPINGEWTLRIHDLFPPDMGSLPSWSIGVVPGVLNRLFHLHIDGEDPYSRLEAGYLIPVPPLT